MQKQTLQIDKAKAKKLFKTAASEFKEMLIDTFGKDYFTGNIMDRITNFNDICLELGTTEEEFKNKWGHLPSDEYAYKQLKLITEVLNEEKNWADFDNTNQYKWWPWHTGGAAGFGFSRSNCTRTITRTDIGSRLCYKTEELATFSGKVFINIWKNFKI